MKCPKCGGTETHAGYGLAAGGLGGYVMCLDCDEVLERYPDPDANEKIPERNVGVDLGRKLPQES